MRKYNNWARRISSFWLPLLLLTVGCSKYNYDTEDLKHPDNGDLAKYISIGNRIVIHAGDQAWELKQPFLDGKYLVGSKRMLVPGVGVMPDPDTSVGPHKSHAVFQEDWDYQVHLYTERAIDSTLDTVNLHYQDIKYAFMFRQSYRARVFRHHFWEIVGDGALEGASGKKTFWQQLNTKSKNYDYNHKH